MSCFSFSKPWKKSKSDNTTKTLKNIITHTLDFSKIDIIICDTENKIVYIDTDLNSGITLKNTNNNSIYDIIPKELGEFYGKLHKECQQREVIIKRNILVDNDLYYITIMPLYYYKVLIGSSLKIISYMK